MKNLKFMKCSTWIYFNVCKYRNSQPQYQLLSGEIYLLQIQNCTMKRAEQGFIMMLMQNLKPILLVNTMIAIAASQSQFFFGCDTFIIVSNLLLQFGTNICLFVCIYNSIYNAIEYCFIVENFEYSVHTDDFHCCVVVDFGMEKTYFHFDYPHSHFDYFLDYYHVDG